MNFYQMNGLLMTNNNSPTANKTPNRRFTEQQFKVEEFDDERVDDDEVQLLEHEDEDENKENDNQINKIGDHNSKQSQMSLEQIICEDLHAFENRLMEILATLEPRSKRWRWLLAISILSTLWTATHWLCDVETFESSLWQSLWNHYWFSLNCIILVGLFLIFGIHRRVIQKTIIAQRIREVVGQFNMGCDDQGRLILMPRPPSLFFYNNNNHQQQSNHYFQPPNFNNFYSTQEQDSPPSSNEPLTTTAIPASLYQHHHPSSLFNGLHHHQQHR